MSEESTSETTREVTKVPTGIVGLDEVTRGGLPARRATLICGGPGCGKTLLALEVLVRGARDHGESGLHVSFSEDLDSLARHAMPVGLDLRAAVGAGHVKVVHAFPAIEGLVEAGAFSLEGLQLILRDGMRAVGAKRVSIDGLDALFGALESTRTLRAEVSRLLRWLQEEGVTTIVTGERGDATLTRYGFEEYVSDCVIHLDHRVANQISKRRLRVVKYRGSAHVQDEVPFLIGARGLSVLPITSVGLEHPASMERISTGLPSLDEMFGGEGYFRGSSVLVSGKAGTGKSTLAAAFAAAVCARGERSLHFAFEESAEQLCRNMRSVGLDLERWRDAGLLDIRAFRPSTQGLEEHLVTIFRILEEDPPDCVVLDPITNFISVGTPTEVKSMLTRLLNRLKRSGTTTFMTSLTPGSGHPEETETGISSIMDTWITLEQTWKGHRRHRDLAIVKSRGMAHSEEVRELVMSADGMSVRQRAEGGDDGARE